MDLYVPSLYTFHPDISIHLLHTVLFTFPVVVTGRICLKIRSFLDSDHFLFSHGLSL